MRRFVIYIVLLAFFLNSASIINFASLKVKADTTCSGYNSPNNPYSCNGNGYCGGNGNCTWWAMYKRPDLIKAFTSYPGAGQAWIDNARAKYTITTTVSPLVRGAIAVWNGHVAYVESVNANGTIRISEMNCYTNASLPSVRDPVPNDVTVSNYASLTFLGFILRKNARPDIAIIDRQDAGSNKTAIHLLDASTEYQSFKTQVGTALGQTGNNNEWSFLLGDHNRDGIKDLYAISKYDVGSNSTAVHILDGAYNFQRFLVQTGTVMPRTSFGEDVKFSLGDFNNDGYMDIYVIVRNDVGSGYTALHILDGSYNFQRFLFQDRTGFGQTGSDFKYDYTTGDMNSDGRDDLFQISKQDGSSNFTEVSIMDAASGFKTSVLSNKATALIKTGNDNSWDFGVGDYNEDGKVDLYAINRTDTAKNRTSVHVLDGNTNFTTFLKQRETAFGQIGTSYRMSLAM